MLKLFATIGIILFLGILGRAQDDQVEDISDDPWIFRSTM